MFNPLHFAVQNKNYDMVELLLTQGAFVDGTKRDPFDSTETPLKMIVTLLINEGFITSTNDKSIFASKETLLETINSTDLNDPRHKIVKLLINNRASFSNKIASEPGPASSINPVTNLTTKIALLFFGALATIFIARYTYTKIMARRSWIHQR